MHSSEPTLFHDSPLWEIFLDNHLWCLFSIDPDLFEIWLGQKTHSWQEPSNGSGSQSFDLAEAVLDLTSLSIAFVNTVAPLSMVFVIGFSSVVSPGVSSSTGLLSANSGGVDWCVEDMGAWDGDAECHAIVEWPDGLRRVNSPCWGCNGVLLELQVVWPVVGSGGHVGMKWVDYSNSRLRYSNLLSVVGALCYWLLGAWVQRVSDVGFNSCTVPTYYWVWVFHTRPRVEVWGLVGSVVHWSSVLWVKSTNHIGYLAGPGCQL